MFELIIRFQKKLNYFILPLMDCKIRFYNHTLSFICLLSFLWSGNNLSFAQTQDILINGSLNRAPAYAGQFYSSDSNQLSENLKLLFNEVIPHRTKNIVAVISPHASYVYSGTVAASAYKMIDLEKQYENIFIIGTSHHVNFEGVSTYTLGNYTTPLGNVPVNLSVTNQLIKESDFFIFNKEADAIEHSVEVQLPFLQYYLKKPFKIVPIIIGTQSTDFCKKLAEVLRPYFNEKNLFVISSDFSHYPDFRYAGYSDSLTAKAILSNSPDKLIKTINDLGRKNIPNLTTNLCGWTAVLTLMYLTENNDSLVIEPQLYQNSGYSEYGDKNRVVGYFAITYSIKGANVNNYSFSEKDKADLLRIARNTLKCFLKYDSIPQINPDTLSSQLKISYGNFVSLKQYGELRGCIGCFTTEKPLYRSVQEMVVEAAINDYRFPAVRENELNEISIEISVLTPLKKVQSPEEIILGKHGIYITKEGESGTFLPQVAIENNWNKEQFLGYCSRDKAGWGWDGWKDANIFIFEADVFSEDLLEK